MASLTREQAIKLSNQASNGCYSSSGYGKKAVLGNAEYKKKFSVLCKLSKDINTEKYLCDRIINS